MIDLDQVKTHEDHIALTAHRCGVPVGEVTQEQYNLTMSLLVDKLEAEMAYTDAEAKALRAKARFHQQDSKRVQAESELILAKFMLGFPPECGIEAGESA